ncbi:DUF1129 domain-containing protein [Lacticaseibacillus nasuensis]|uniref:Membrane-associated protein n=1 Tax=Lacticaseibacillus nasuensis JCM 17158 TaxID=1291734 RepID=A0A0R1JZ71_9LACO|nr:DUF1129 family protein [Lacticaseibacillus nasuensis]KRK74041.1 membrane-associated protein [Lacticaseibacillus nasuensis JCM 17158]
MAKETKEEQVIEVDVDALLGELSKKNDEYVFKLRRILTENGYSEDKQRDILANLLPDMVQAQHEGKPANQLYGPVTVEADHIMHAPKPAPKVPFWLSATDLSLFFMSMFCLIYGFMAYFSSTAKQMQQGSGILSLLVMSIMAGVMFSYFNTWNRLPKDKRPKTWILLLAGVALILVFSFLSSVLVLIKSPLTSAMAWPVYGVFAVLCYGAHFFLKRKYKLPGLFAN